MRAAIMELLRHCSERQLRMVYSFIAAMVLERPEWEVQLNEKND